ncbi:prolactin-like [Salminus brasiliensis]|uniref:prolactin-like n=1 Tax=Salminus brasiliensis TaxID=930266 RepID=UPI003B8345E8
MTISNKHIQSSPLMKTAVIRDFIKSFLWASGWQDTEVRRFQSQRVRRMLEMPRTASLLAMLCVSAAVRVAPAPLCPHGQPACLAISLADLFDRVIQHSSRVQGLSSDLHSEFEQSFIPNKNQIGTRRCHTSNIVTPNGKENVQKLAGEKLTEVILKLLMAWGEPLAQFHESMTQQQDYNIYSSNKALEMSDMVYELKNGVQKVAEKMQLLGIISNFLNGQNFMEGLDAVDSSEVFSVDNPNLLHCFRRDSDKIHSYLNILKCRILPENRC